MSRWTCSKDKVTGASIELTRLGSKRADGLNLGPAGTTDSGARVRKEPGVPVSLSLLAVVPVVFIVISVGI